MPTSRPSPSSEPAPGPVQADSPLGIIAGSGFLEGLDPEALGIAVEVLDVATSRGSVRVQRSADFVFLRRHGEGKPHLPHRIPHHAHVLALEALGVDRVVGLTSTGSLCETLEPGTIVVPEDYLSRHAPPTFAGDGPLHIVPGLDDDLRIMLEGVAAAAAGAFPSEPRPAVHRGGVYAETRGPRFETRAEVRSLARDADVVGMTAASEATLCQERGMRYAILGLVDNWAHGVVAEPLSLDGFRARQAENRSLARTVLTELIRSIHPPGHAPGGP